MQPRAVAPHQMADIPVPQFWEEWLWSVYPPDEWITQWQGYGVTIDAAANRANNTDKIQVPVQYFCWGVATNSITKADGTKPLWEYRIGLKNATGNDWTNGQWMKSVVTGELATSTSPSAGYGVQPWRLPREVAANEVVTITIDNNVNANALELLVDIFLFGYEVRNRQHPIQRDHDGRVLLNADGSFK